MHARIPPPRYKNLPRHGKYAGTPMRLDPAERKMIGVTGPIRKYVDRFQAESQLQRARKIVANIKKFKKVRLHLVQAKRLWAKRSATDIITSRKVYVVAPTETIDAKMPVLRGCTDLAVAVTAALRAIGLKAWIARMGAHTYTKFVYRKKVFIADAYELKRVGPRRARKRHSVRRMGRPDRIIENSHRTDKSFAEGKSLAEIGIKSFNDFCKYY